MDVEEEKKKIGVFLKAGIIILSGVLLIASGIQFIPDVISVSSTSNGRELPIYCVNREDNKVALSFDAAWGNGRMRKELHEM